MYTQLNTEQFTSEFITRRRESLLAPDIDRNREQLTAMLSGRRVMVIGGAGTIGSQYIKALLRFGIGGLVVVDTSENGLTELVRDLRSSVDYQLPAEFITYPVNFGNHIFGKIFRSLGPFDIVANFAAHKHVRSEKDIFSVEAMIDNNILRAQRLLNLLLEFPPQRFFCVSTDKAANPVNIMGASKKLMEELIMAYSDKLHITTARFANVAFSNGSLLQGFTERLNNMQPWACPADIKRYFVSPRESGELCMIASLLPKSGEILFPKLDPERDMISFERVARDLLGYLGLKPDICHSEEDARRKAANMGENPQSWPLYLFNSTTTGEKQYEEFVTAKEKVDNNRFINLGVIKAGTRRSMDETERMIASLRTFFAGTGNNKEKLVKLLKEWLPDFDHIEKNRGLDSGI